MIINIEKSKNGKWMYYIFRCDFCRRLANEISVRVKNTEKSMINALKIIHYFKWKSSVRGVTHMCPNCRE